MKRTLLTAFACLAFGVGAMAHHVEPSPFIPQPQAYKMIEGQSFLLTPQTVIVYTEDNEAAAQYLAEELKSYVSCGLKLLRVKNAKQVRKIKQNAIVLSNATDCVPESYELYTNERSIVITGDLRGLIHGINTMLQMMPLPVAGATSVQVPAFFVKDHPHSSWRGIMLDCSRHFFSVSEVKEVLDLMARYKLNKFHWHLTDDQGWRVQIDRYPMLTEKGAWRTFNNQDQRCLQRAAEEDNPRLLIPEDKCRTNAQGETEYGGFYTKDDIREIVAYAAQRGIDVIPEIDMPGHMLAGVSNYDGVSCFPETGWGSAFSSPVCPGKDSALEFCKNVYEEILPLFPYEYVHIGGDEVEKTNWKKCPDCQARIKSEGLADEEQLQAWFIHQMEDFFRAHGKKMIGWDETSISLYHAQMNGTTAELKPTAALSNDETVMWWRGWNEEVPPLVTRHGNDIIYSPNSILYLDNDQDQFSIDNILRFNPLISHGETGTMTATEEDHILGYQGNIWCEQIPSREHLFYQMMPRTIALAEKAWGGEGRVLARQDCTLEGLKEPFEAPVWDDAHLRDFHRRLDRHYSYLKAEGIPYHLPELKGMYNVNAFLEETDLSVTCADASSRIYYSTDGSYTLDKMQPLPSEIRLNLDGSTELIGTLHVKESMDVTFRQVTSDGTPTEIVQTRFQKDSFTDALGWVGTFDADGTFKQTESATLLPPPNPFKPGLKTVWHEFSGGDCRLIKDAPVNAEYECENVCIPVGVKGNIGLITTGYISLPEDGIYTFALFCDDGSDLVIDNIMVVDNNREQYPRELICQKALCEGLHPMTLRYFDHNGGLLRLRVFDPQGREMTPAELYVH
ncbi:MAG: family 20 glycosylhydrolase [Bacteroidales bacterium]|nr:family 20 glycosylhydrolase [Bacteroidales bacterium]